jgi:hypothetical protein
LEFFLIFGFVRGLDHVGVVVLVGDRSGRRVYFRLLHAVVFVSGLAGKVTMDSI